MKLDIKKIKIILEKDYSFYDQMKVKYKSDQRLNPSVIALLKQELRKDFHVLDMGCGDGHTLIELSKNFKKGVGVDNDVNHISLAQKNKKDHGVKNISFVQARSDNLPFKAEEFDFIFSERGPISGNNMNIQSAMRTLKINGLLFEETIGELDNKETNEIFHRGQQYQKYRLITRVDEVKVLFERNGIDIRIVNNLTGTIIFANIYDWLEYQCAVWTYNGVCLPALDEVNKINEFMVTNQNENGEIIITKHRVWIGGVKKRNPPEYWEFNHFKK